MKKIITIVGARPQFVKLAPFSREVRKHWREVIVHTGQHYDPKMSATFFGELGIPKPDRQLAIGGGSHGAQTGRMVEAIENILLEEEPAAVVVFGDTNSTLAGALAAAKLEIPTIHVEAGLRSFNRSMPEEINRVVADHTADLLFAPTAAAMRNLEREGLGGRSVQTGDIMVDVVLGNRERAKGRNGILSELGLEPGGYSLLTLHRPYTVDNPEVLERLLKRLEMLEEAILFPVHPRTRKTLEKIGRGLASQTLSVAAAGGGGLSGFSSVDNGVLFSGDRGRRLRLIEPAGYLEFLCLQDHAHRILTDSGGIQKEAYILRKPCVTLRTETEWVETVEAGWNLLLSPDTPDLAEQIERFAPPENQPSIFGENVAETMLGSIRAFLDSSAGR